MTPRELGPYLLLRKLSEDSLRETYRAGQKSGEDVERVVLLCFFKASREDATWLAETATVGRRALQGLSSPFLADVVDSGELAGSAYLSYEYISGIGLPEVMRKAPQEGAPVPLDVAIHVVDRVAAGLLAAWEHESRMLHGFVVPQLVMLSNEGEVRLLGIEVASRLRRLLVNADLESQVRSYLAPEVVPASQAATTDDVYSLGALLFALSTGKPLPRDDSDPLAHVESASTPDGRSLPESIRNLLSSSLAPAQNRARLAEWHSDLRQLALSDEYEATSFNLALYLNRLLGEALDEPAGEAPAAATRPPSTAPSETAGSQDPPKATEPEPPAETAPPSTPDEPAFADSDLDTEFAARESDEAASRRPLLAAAAVVLLLAAAGGAYYFTRPDPGERLAQQSSPTQTEVAVEPPESANDALTSTDEVDLGTPQGATEPATTPPADTAPQPTPEELDRKVRQLAAQQSKEIEGALRDQYEREIAALRAQLEAAAVQAEDEAASNADDETSPARATDSPSEIAPQEVAQTVSEGPGGTDVEAVEPGGLTGAQTGAQTGAPTTPRDAEGSGETPTGARPEANLAEIDEAATDASISSSNSARPPIESSETGAPETGASETGASGAGSAEPSQSNSAESSPTGSNAAPDRAASHQASGTTERSEASSSASRSAAVRKAPVRLGQLVSVGPDVASPQLERSVRPIYPMVARRLGKAASVDLRVLIDENGDVTEVEQVGAEAGFGFDAAARDAARQMKWKPATKDGVRVKIWWPVRIEFQP